MQELDVPAPGGEDDAAPTSAHTKLEWCTDHRGLMHLVEMCRDFGVPDDAPDHLKWKLVDGEMEIVGAPRAILKAGNGVMAVPRALFAMAVLQKAFPDVGILASTFDPDAWDKDGSEEVFFVVPKSFHAKITEMHLLANVAKLIKDTDDVVTLVHATRLLDLNFDPPGDVFEKAPEEEIARSVLSALSMLRSASELPVLLQVPGENAVAFDLAFISKAQNVRV